jgi:hypothetical protein
MKRTLGMTMRMARGVSTSETRARPEKPLNGAHYKYDLEYNRATRLSEVFGASGFAGGSESENPSRTGNMLWSLGRKVQQLVTTTTTRRNVQRDGQTVIQGTRTKVKTETFKCNYGEDQNA